MRRFKAFVIGFVSFLVTVLAQRGTFAAHPPLDRPTPPPCCADGICYPNPVTWGWYETRWRRWPTEDLQPTPAAPVPAEQVGPDIMPYETPTPEEEDRRAPPPSKSPADEQEAEPETPATTPVRPPTGIGTEPAPSGEPTSPPTVRPFSSPLAPPTPPSAAPGTRMPWENGEEPTGDWDPPPAPPTMTAAARERSSMPASALPAPPRPTGPQQQPGSNGSDPPPSLPISLASASY